MLEALGVMPIEEQIYLALLQRPQLSVAELVRTANRGGQSVRAAVHRLEDLGFVSRLVGSPAKLVAARPDVAVNALVVKRTEEFAEAQRAAVQLAAEVPQELQSRPEDLFEIVVGRGAVEAQFVQMLHGIHQQLLVLDRPPYAQAVAAANVSETDLLARGAEVRGIYAPEAFELPGAFDQAMVSVRAGELARVHAQVPMKLAVGDGSVALLPLTNEGEVDSALVVRGPTVVVALMQLFELLWQQACPLPEWDRRRPPPVTDEVDRELLALLTTGMKDEAIARDLGISVRTLGRRMARLLEVLGARTRFQAGLQAHRWGLD